MEKFRRNLAIGLLSITSIAKIASLLQFGRFPTTRLATPNIVFPFLSDGAVIAFAAVLEILIIALLLSKAKHIYKYAALAWLATCFAIYHHLSTVFRANCGCIGFWDKDSIINSDSITSALLYVLIITAGSGLLESAYVNIFSLQRLSGQPLQK